ncbi:MAG: hypothetical protein M0Q91_13830 [Methanoregula sp.]|jgi:hypothetical protein|nr:hypothetical protein [Methanoregula sp.]
MMPVERVVFYANLSILPFIVVSVGMLLLSEFIEITNLTFKIVTFGTLFAGLIAAYLIERKAIKEMSDYEDSHKESKI